ncbi:MAG: GNAT family N-acetyltransferase, partial [Geminicoccaceae bacterium]
MSEVRIERLTGDRLKLLLPDLARLRIAVFRAFPYLYEGSLEYEERYLQTYHEAADSVIVGAF